MKAARGVRRTRHSHDYHELEMLIYVWEAGPASPTMTVGLEARCPPVWRDATLRVPEPGTPGEIANHNL